MWVFGSSILIDGKLHKNKKNAAKSHGCEKHALLSPLSDSIGLLCISIIIIYLYFYGMATYHTFKWLFGHVVPMKCGTFHLIPLNASKIFK